MSRGHCEQWEGTQRQVKVFWRKGKGQGYIALDIGACKEWQAGYGHNRGEKGEHYSVGGCRKVRPENERRI